MLKDYAAYATLAMQIIAVVALSYVLTLGIKDCLLHCKIDHKAMGRNK